MFNLNPWWEATEQSVGATLVLHHFQRDGVLV
jgi:hypothetical protein